MKTNILCKFRSMLVIMECKIHNNEYEGSCPDCGNKRFIKDGEWTSCIECGFSALIQNEEVKKMIDQSSNSVIGLINSTLGEKAYNFVEDREFIVFTYLDLSFRSDNFLNIEQYSSVKHKFMHTATSLLMTKLLYAEHKDIINKWFNQ